MSFTFAWWNTSLSPSKSLNRSDEQAYAVVATVLTVLLDIMKIDFVALGEVSGEDLSQIQAALPAWKANFLFISTAEKAGHGKFDTALVYRVGLDVTPRQPVVRVRGQRTARVAQHFDIELDPCKEKLHCFVSHWSSPLSFGFTPDDRAAGAELLRSAIDEARQTENSPVVVMGDFNVEPFDGAIGNALQSSRDRTLVTRRPHVLYNPFWRHLSSYHHADAEHRFTDRGTCYLPNDELTRWKTVDQILFSAALASGSGGWHLDELATRVFDIPELAAVIADSSTHFDHLPVVGRINRMS